MKPKVFTCIAALAVVAVLAAPIGAAAQDNPNGEHATLITFDAPGAGTGAGQGTQSLAISPPGARAPGLQVGVVQPSPEGAKENTPIVESL